MPSKGSGTAGGKVILQFDMAAAIDAALKGLEKLTKKNSDKIDVGINQQVNLPVTEVVDSQSNMGMLREIHEKEFDALDDGK